MLKYNILSLPATATPLFAAVSENNYERVKELLEDESNLDQLDERVMLTAEHVSDQILDQDWTPLIFACCNGLLNIAKLLIEKGASLTVKRLKTGNTPFNAACFSGNTELIEYLLEKGADWRLASNDGWTPLMSSVQENHIALAKLLLTKGVDVNASCASFNALYSAADKGRTELVELLIEHGASVNEKTQEGWTALAAAAQFGFSSIVDALLKAGADVNAVSNCGWSSLMLASQNGHLSIVERLIEHGAGINIRSNTSKFTALFSAIKNGHYSICELLLEKGASISKLPKETFFPLYIAAESGRAEIAELLLKYGANVNERTSDNWTCLMIATYNQHISVIKVLLDAKGILIDDCPAAGYTSFMLSCQNNNLPIIKLFLERGANLHAKSTHHLNCLMIAARSGHPEIMRYLIQKGVGVDQRQLRD